MNDESISSLPAATVDLNAIHDALIAGDSVAVATRKGRLIGAGLEVPTFDSLSGATTADLTRIAKKEKVDLEGLANNDQRTAAIEAGRLAQMDAAIPATRAPAVAAPATPPPASVDGATEAALNAAPPPADAGDAA